jgi:osmotically-inducible protein OsmY
MLRFMRYVGLGALIAYFFDPQNGNRRRALVRDRLQAKVAKRKEAVKTQPDDVTLARKVETEIFRDADVPKGQINVNAENGKVVLRGEVEKPAMIKDLEKRTKNVQGVVEVENLLHTPKSATPAK